ncbi:MAG: diguanylate cyclase, partial [Egibacteraceae bacterium]
RRLGLRMGSALLLVSLALAGAAMGAAATEGTLEARTVVHLLRVHGFLALMLLLVAGVASLREQLHRALERSAVLSSRAMTDPLTGLGNRWAAEERLAEEIEDAGRRDRSVAVVMVDVDDFKAINDRHGHSTGDAVLAAIAALIDDEVRARDLVARWGGEEFLVVLPEVGADEAARAAERCRVAVAEGAPGGVAVTATFGVAGLAAGEGAGALLRRADLALYEGKRLGRDRVVVAETPASPPSGAEATHHGPASVAPAPRERGDERAG